MANRFKSALIGLVALTALECGNSDSRPNALATGGAAGVVGGSKGGSQAAAGGNAGVPGGAPGGGVGGDSSGTAGADTVGGTGGGSAGSIAAGSGGNGKDGTAGSVTNTGGTSGGAGDSGDTASPPPPWSTPTPDDAFTANFIWQAADGPANSWLAFRKQVTLSAAPARATAAIAADSKYWLWINGQLAVFEGGLKRGPNRTDTYYDEVELAPFLRAGDNTIAVLVWFWGKAAFSHVDSGKGGLLFQADIDGTQVVSDETWKVRPHPGYVAQTEPAPNFRLPEWNVQFDARLDLTGWTEQEYDDADWTAATEKGQPPAAPWMHLWKRPIPQWRDFGLKDYTNAAALPTTGTGGVVRALLPYNAQVTPYLRVTAPAGEVIRIQTDLHGEGPTVRAEYTTREGEQEYESLGWMNGHAIEYTIPSGVTIQSLRYRETGFDTDFSGSFLSNDEALNTLWTKSRRTLYLTMRDNYMDCPTRERAQWWGDVVIEMGQTFYALDRRSDGLSSKAINNLIEWRRQDGTLYSPVPGIWTDELPQQMLASIGRAGFFNYYLHTGDAAAIRAVYPTVRSYLDLWQRSDDGLVQHRAGDWDWGDWGNNIDNIVLENAWYYMALDGAARMADLVEEAEDATAYRTRMAEFKTAFLARFWNGTELRTPERVGSIDERGHGLAVVAGLLGAEEWPAVRSVLNSVNESGPYMEKYVLEAFFVMNDASAGLARMRRRYADMIESPLTTLWEVWVPGDPVVPVEGGGTVNHAWTGGPLTLLSQYVAGVAPTEPGYTAFEVLPQLGDLTSVAVSVPSAKGTITVDIERGPPFTLKVRVPSTTRAVVGIPLDAVTTEGADRIEIRLAGTVVFTAGNFVPNPAISLIGNEAGYVKFELAPGTHEFAASEI